MIDQQERNKVWNTMIIYRSVAVGLPLDVSKCGVTTSEVDWMSCCNYYVICMTWQTQCIHYSGLCFRLGRWERPLCKRYWNGAQCHCRNLVQFDPSLQVLYLTMLLAQHRQLATDNHWSISGKCLCFVHRRIMRHIQHQWHKHGGQSSKTMAIHSRSVAVRPLMLNTIRPVPRPVPNHSYHLSKLRGGVYSRNIGMYLRGPSKYNKKQTCNLPGNWTTASGEKHRSRQ